MEDGVSQNSRTEKHKMSLNSSEIVVKIIHANDVFFFIIIIRFSDRSEEERGRDRLRRERHQERERDRRTSKAAPDKRYNFTLILKRSIRLYF